MNQIEELLRRLVRFHGVETIDEEAIAEYAKAITDKCKTTDKA